MEVLNMGIYKIWDKTGPKLDYYVDYRFEGRRTPRAYRHDKALAETVYRKRRVENRRREILRQVGRTLRLLSPR